MNQDVYRDAMEFIRNLVIGDNGVPRNIKANALNVLLKEAGKVYQVCKGVTIADNDRQEITALLENQKKIAAIKHLRTVTGLNLAPAKDIIDEWFN